MTTKRLAVAAVLGLFASCGGNVLNDVGDLPGKPDASADSSGTGGGGTGGTTAGTGGSISPGSGGVGGGTGGGGTGGGGCGCSNTTTVSLQVIGVDDVVGDRSSIECDAYRFERRYVALPDPSSYDYWLLCSGQLAACGSDLIDTGDVSSALEHPDVVAAIAASSMFYGSDPRPTTGGTVVQIRIGTALIEIGDECGDYPGCVDAPAGVAELLALLRALEEHELSEGSCATRCPDPPNAQYLGEPCSKYGQECPFDGSWCAIRCENGAWVSNGVRGTLEYICEPVNVGGAAGTAG